MLPSLTQRLWQLVLVLLAVIGLVAVTNPALAVPAGERPSHGATAPGGTYLALGDSVPFGYVGNRPDLYPDPDNFVGYPELVARDLGLRLLNASCPGETTASFIDATAQSNGCQNSFGSDLGYRDRFPLHVDYEGSQLDYALQVLEEEPHVRLVTLQLGANDGFLCQRTGECSTPEGLAALAERVRVNLDHILCTLREEGDYRGRLVVVTYYALDYADPVGVASTRILNAAITAAAAENRAVVADGFTAFQSRALQAGGSSIAAGLVHPNDVHPTAEGQRLLADAVERAVGH
ncbi:SGNH/GDSL hydrolase family protein [Blastococcus deserti]|uniref:SGNH/GDSL hydrolase family protein n=1 Tax=Blastococcus deserti TaxID=2259033 RepID=A0ABW4XG41_9ACTN